MEKVYERCMEALLRDAPQHYFQCGQMSNRSNLLNISVHESDADTVQDIYLA